MDYAGGGEDYDSGPYSVKFNAGMTEVTLNVSIVDDDILERNEKFILAVNVSSLPNKVSVGDHGRATATIVDNDGKYTVADPNPLLPLHEHCNKVAINKIRVM